MNLKKILISSAICILATVSCATTQEAQAAENIKIQINGQIYSDSNIPNPENINSRVYVPLRVVSEGLGHSVEWDAVSRSVLIDSQLSSLQTVIAEWNSLNIFIDNKQLIVDSYNGTPYISAAGYTMVPVRVVAENLGANVSWSGKTQTVIINTSDTKESRPTPSITVPDVTTPSIAPPSGETVNNSTSASTTTLAGNSGASLEQMKRYIAQKEASVKISSESNGRQFVPFPENIAEYYYTIGQKYGIRGDVALAQALHETGNFQYGNEVKAWQNNFCGLGAIGRPTTEADLTKQRFSAVNGSRAYLQVGLNGWVYVDVATGVEAHIQHLYSYAYAGNLPEGVDLLDGRFAHGNRGKAKYLTDLNGKWAVPGNNYGEIIYKNYLQPMMQ